MYETSGMVGFSDGSGPKKTNAGLPRLTQALLKKLSPSLDFCTIKVFSRPFSKCQVQKNLGSGLGLDPNPSLVGLPTFYARHLLWFRP